MLKVTEQEPEEQDHRARPAVGGDWMVLREPDVLVLVQNLLELKADVSWFSSGTSSM